MARFLQENHVVQAWPPIDVNTTPTSDLTTLNTAEGVRVISLKNWDHVCVLINFGLVNAASAADITCYACSNVAGANAVALSAYPYRQTNQTTTDASEVTTDIWTSDITIADSDIDIGDESDLDPLLDGSDTSIYNGMVAIEFDAADIFNVATDNIDRDCFYVTVSDPGNVVTCGAIYVLSKAGYRTKVQLTAVAD